jgi:uracil phosphoribosyltransferase
MVVHCFETQHSLLNRYMAEIRDRDIQKDRMRFRRNIARIGEILAYELSKTLDYKTSTVTTPLGNKEIALPQDIPVLCSILRAGLPLHQGLLSYFDNAESAFVSAYRHHPGGADAFEVVVNYLAAPEIQNRVLIISDPMLATGKTLENVLGALKGYGTPRQIHLVSVVGAREGINYVAQVFPPETHLWIAAVDDDLSVRGYIVPGLGDAGDLAFGPKL